MLSIPTEMSLLFPGNVALSQRSKYLLHILLWLLPYSKRCSEETSQKGKLWQREELLN